MAPAESAAPVPFWDLTRQYAALEPELRPALDRVLARGKYTLGPELAQFEQEFAAYCGVHHAVGVASGTAALHLALLAFGIGPGDEVITVPNTYAATAFAISYTGATPVFADVDPDTYNLDPVAAAQKITGRTRALLPVHLYGQPADMDALNDLARRHNLFVVEDAAHAHGATYGNRKAGALGDIGCFSFYPTKLLGAYGDAGALTTNDPDLAARLRALRYLGQSVQHAHDEVGYQERLDEIQAAVLRVKLTHLDAWIARRQALAERYNAALRSLRADAPRGLVPPFVAPGRTHVYYVYTMRVPDGRRDALRRALDAQGISSLVVYPTLVPFQKAYASLGYRPGDFPVAERLNAELLSLPLHSELTDEEQARVIDALKQ